MTFEQAYLRLKEIHQILKSDQIIDITILTNLQKEAQECHTLCNTLIKKSESHQQ